MGFDLSITCSLNLCPTTGKPYYMDVQHGEVVLLYGIPDITIPQPFRQFIHQRGNFFHAYTTSRAHSDYSDITEMSVHAFLDQYPEWMDVLVDVNYHTEDGWTKSDHLEFKKALQWFAEQKVDYTVKWSY